MPKPKERLCKIAHIVKRRGSFLDLWLVVQNDIQQGTMDLDSAIVFDEPQSSKFVHKKTYAGSGCSNHLRKRLLTDLGDYPLRVAVLAEVRQQKEYPGKSFLAGIEQLVDQARLHADCTFQKVGNEQFRESRLPMDHTENGGLFKAYDDRRCHCHRGRHALGLARETSFAKKDVPRENCDNRFLALLRDDGELYLAVLNIETASAGSPCEKTICSVPYLPMLRPSPTLARKVLGLNVSWDFLVIERISRRQGPHQSCRGRVRIWMGREHGRALYRQTVGKLRKTLRLPAAWRRQPNASVKRPF
jgi:hypothetical protein